MKLTHELCNEAFAQLSIDEKRNLIAIIAEYNMACEKHHTWVEDHIHAAAIVGEESGELLQAAIQHKYEKGQYYQIHREAMQTGAACLRLLVNMPKKELPGETKDTEPKYQTSF